MDAKVDADVLLADERLGAIDRGLTELEARMGPQLARDRLEAIRASAREARAMVMQTPTPWGLAWAELLEAEAERFAGLLDVLEGEDAP